jgi:P4 family phage/plasmid primase-like protien
MERLNEIISDCFCHGDLHTHVIVSGGKVNIGSAKALDFWDSYMKCVENHNNMLHLAENPLNELPILVDVDLRAQVSKGRTKLYTLEQVKKIIRTYQTILKTEIIDGEIRNDTLVCVLLEKKAQNETINDIKYIKHGFHLHFPKCFMDVKAQKAYLLPMVKRELKGMFNHLYTDYEGSDSDDIIGSIENISPEYSHDFIDEKSLHVHWLMYGSRKKDGIPYIATKCYDSKGRDIDFEVALGDYILPKLKGQKEATTCAGQVMKLLPRILSTRLHGRDEYYYYRPKTSINTPVTEMFAEVKKNRTAFVQKSINETLVDARNLLDIISSARADCRSDWLSIGYCLHNITKGDDDGLALWLEFSDRSPKFNEAECICMWERDMKENLYSIGTLKYFAKLDNPNMYEEYCRLKGTTLIDKAVDGGHSDMAKILLNEYHNEFVFSLSDKRWYHFEDHIWTGMDVCYDLSERISNNNGAIISQFYDHIDSAKRELKSLGHNYKAKSVRKKSKLKDDDCCDDFDIDDDEFLVERLINKISTLEKLIKQCKSNTFKSSVMKECAEVFRIKDFSDKLNKNKYLVAFKNGVYDFKNYCFRDGQPEDYLSVSTNIDYIDYKSIDHLAVRKVIDFFRKVLPDDDVREYFFDEACQLFIGGNPDRHFVIWTGSGANGKSITQQFFQKMLGKMAVKMSTSLITGKKSELGKPTPELARTDNGVRWLVMDEPSKGEKITTGTLKQLTGNDSFFARGLFKDGHDIVPMFKLVMICNELPDIQDPDAACWQRIRVIPFESKFVEESECPDTYTEQIKQKTFLMDLEISDKIDEMLSPFAYYLIHHLKRLNKKNWKTPTKVLIATNVYQDDNTDDPVSEFIDEMCNKNKNGEILFNVLHNSYYDWFSRNYPHQEFKKKRKNTIKLFSKVMGSLQTKTTTTKDDDRVDFFKGFEWKKNMNDNPMLF